VAIERRLDVFVAETGTPIRNCDDGHRDRDDRSFYLGVHVGCGEEVVILYLAVRDQQKNMIDNERPAQ